MQPFALLNKMPRGLKVYFNDKIVEYQSIKDFELKYGKLEFIRTAKVDEDQNILGFPCPQQEIYDIVEDEKYPTFKKSQKSNVKYVAGYWAIKFKNDFVIVFCPKLSTVQKHESVGPRKDMFDLKMEISSYD